MIWLVRGLGAASLARVLTLAAAAALCLAPVQAQSPPPPSKYPVPQAEGEDPDRDDPAHEAAELVGATVFTADGTDVGEVGAVTLGPDGQIASLHVTIAATLGLGTRTVELPQGTFVALRGAVVLDMTTQDLARLPSPTSAPTPGASRSSRDL
jgi:sporulation protein YlmC with PRC-barrel domain